MASSNVLYQLGLVSSKERSQLLAGAPCVVWLTGLSGSGKSTLAYALERVLFEREKAAYVLDGDNVRHGLCRDLGFSAEDRSENIRRVAEVARLMYDAGLIVIVSFISPYRADREMARAIIGSEHFFEVHVSTPLAVCEARDPKGLYSKARAGQLEGFTGVSAPYEEPVSPALQLDTSVRPLPESLDCLLRLIHIAQVE